MGAFGNGKVHLETARGQKTNLAQVVELIKETSGEGGIYTRPSQSIWYPLCNVLLHSYCLHRSVQRLAQLEALQALTTLRLLADHIQDQVNQFGTGLPKDEVV